MKYLLFLLFTTQCLAGNWIICAVRQSDGAVSWHCDSVSQTIEETPPAGCVWQAFPKATWTATAQELQDGVLVLQLQGNKVVHRDTTVVASERAAKANTKAKAEALKVLKEAKQAVDTLTAEVADDPNNTVLTDELTKAQGELKAARMTLKALK